MTVSSDGSGNLRSGVSLRSADRDPRRFDSTIFHGPVSERVHDGMLAAGYERVSVEHATTVYVRDRIAEARRRLGRSAVVSIGERGIELD